MCNLRMNSTSIHVSKKIYFPAQLGLKCNHNTLLRTAHTRIVRSCNTFVIAADNDEIKQIETIAVALRAVLFFTQIPASFWGGTAYFTLKCMKQIMFFVYVKA